MIGCLTIGESESRLATRAETFGGDPAGNAAEVDGLGAAGADEALVEGGPVARFFSVDESEREGDEAVEKVVELVLVAEIGPALAADGVDGVLIETACAPQ